MFTPRMRRTLIVVVSTFAIWIVLSPSSNKDLHVPSKFSPRPPYLLFQPPRLKDYLWSPRAESVKQAFLHAYRGYEQYAPFPADELLPLTNESVEK